MLFLIKELNMELDVKQLLIKNGKCGVEETLKILYSKWNVEILTACRESITIKDLQQNLQFIPRTTLNKNISILLRNNLLMTDGYSYALSESANELLLFNEQIDEYFASFISFTSLEEKYDYINKAFGKKWKARIIWILHTYEKARFNELCNCLEGISHKVLKEVLLDLEDAEIINRFEYLGKVPKVEYTLTEKGKNIAIFVFKLSEWSRKNGLLTQKVTVNIE